ncbi:hypothetical protein [Legionella tucsonensis]|uniref:Uncharacterized protein n=1 Tax=Legionella tucsonensis TaxID=40335 RepID=A0A0W0ZXY0_9GAMM|nr:hypothetical protein [Legionella tucsonensis]KTD73894.1 hypothetical protein Ltuc_1741 [Legionella tucsonensis]
MGGVNSNSIESTSTQTIIQSLKPRVVQEIIRASPIDRKEKAAVSNDFLNRLNILGLESDPRTINLITKYPQSGNRLISLFKVLKDFQITLTDQLEYIIAQNISNVGGAVHLLGVMKELDINPHFVVLELLFQSARADETVVQSARYLKDGSLLDRFSFNLILTYPEESLNISQFLIDLQGRAYDPKSLIDKLRASSISTTHMNTMLKLLSFLLINDIYDLDIVDILLRKEQFIDKIYEGAKKLSAVPELLSDYFELLEGNPENANIFAKNLLLLHSVSLISCRSSKEDFLKVSQLGVGTFHFMNHLQQAGMLNAESYQKIYENNSTLERPDIISSLINLPLMTKFTPEELVKMMALVAKPAISVTLRDVDGFNEVLEEHQFRVSRAPGCSPMGSGR